jgi:hypothetical protein
MATQSRDNKASTPRPDKSEGGSGGDTSVLAAATTVGGATFGGDVLREEHFTGALATFLACVGIIAGRPGTTPPRNDIGYYYILKN